MYDRLYDRALEQVKERLNQIIEDYKVAEELRVIDIEGRVKKIGSIIDKAHRMNTEPSHALTKLNDLVGLRILCNNLQDVYQVLGLIEREFDKHIIPGSKKDYIDNPNSKTGYRGIHLLIWTEVQHSGRPSKVTCEIQLRTLAQNLWAVLSHADIFKNEDIIPREISRKMINLGSILALVDDEAKAIRSDIENVTSTSYIPYRLNDPIDKESFLSYLRDKYGLALKGFWTNLHFANLETHGIKTLEEIEQLLSNARLMSELETVASKIAGREVRFSPLDRIYFGVIANKAGIGAVELAVRSCLLHKPLTG